MSGSIYLNEKDEFEEPIRKTKSTFKKLIKWGLLSVAAITLISSALTYHQYINDNSLEFLNESKICPKGDIIRPQSFLKDNSSIEEIIYSKDYRLDSIKKLSGAVKIPTVTNDTVKSPIDSPSDWNEFARFHWFLESQFPLVYSKLKVEKINKYGLLFTWEGSNSDLKPLLLLAHQDVVPVEPVTLKDWKFPPFDGEYDDEFIYGRGSSDCKSLVIGYLQAFEKLLKDDFEPNRTHLIALGFDEEIGGPWGAATISKILEDRYGKDSIFAVLDEGGSSVEIIDDIPIALPSIGEKGSLNSIISLTTPGGHSSIPPDHTNIGIFAKLLNEIESTPFDSNLSANNPVLNYLQCVAKHTNSIPNDVKNSIFKAGYDSLANSKVIEYLSKIRELKYSVRTSQAIDIFNGGIKSNALPEFSEVVINHRVAIESSIDETISKILNNVKNIADEFDLGIYLNDQEIKPKSINGYFNLDYSKGGLNPAKVSPVDNESFNLFRGSIKHILNDYVYPNLNEPIVAGNLNSGNTDTNRYWSLSDNIYRYKFSTLNGLIGAGTHSVNEKVKIDDLISLIAFIYEYVRNVDEFQEY
ncbi:hypothetical protein WICMUC_004498 [Wickerhamomyces mucosus]|uniref:Peptidase M20 dimerisation domain-containing protein n=1 Tax=Wickerhamomyces mucosus TaxID=1378264 RepID=A0A9P8TBB9_9ASCO|nr:hypothetical protein WICMUC_004498 [Wickerhamomyces mucosus]